MAKEVKLPKLGVEMTSARLEEWLIEDGATVAADDPIATLETEKVVYELTAPGAGQIRISAEAGEEYEIGDLLAHIAGSPEEFADLPADGSATGGSTPAEPAAASADFPAPVASNGSGGGTGSDHRDSLAVRRRAGEPLSSPLARRIAADRNIDLNLVTGTGIRGAIRRRDVEAAIASGGASAAPSVTPAVPSGPEFVDAPLTPMRRTIADRMLGSMQSTAQMTDVREQDVSDLVRLRTKLAARADVLGYKVSYTALFVKMAAIALEAVPEMNASIEGDSFRQYNRVNIGIAVALDEGLIVPVLKDVGRMSVGDINVEMNRLIESARTRTLKGEEMSGGTFTISNFGSYGSHFGTPILTPGQASTLGLGTLIERPVVRDGNIEVGKVMFTSVTVDHRVVDGESSGKFQNELGKLLADPELILLG
ncbi:MAG: 2-oxo acid dehydrogenase subunit E2 [Actinomycetota bacterium]|nr:2-oxo acid dehydrogenase subunit E2 [Actinomycetota bacterium]